VAETPGAGGYGAPAARARADIGRDLASGKFSADYVACNYPPGSVG
jgi:N-methylhydantoinase B